MRFTKAKIVAAGMILAGICMIAPQQLRAEVPQEQMDGVMAVSYTHLTLPTNSLV